MFPYRLGLLRTEVLTTRYIWNVPRAHGVVRKNLVAVLSCIMGRGTAGPGQCGSDLYLLPGCGPVARTNLEPFFMFRTAPSPFNDDTYYARNCFEFSEDEQLFMKAIDLCRDH